jgi:adenylate cyclase
VARRALDEGVRLRGERRQASALFVDVINSTGVAARSAPEDVVVMLNRFFAEVVRAVDAEEGWVNKFEGDGALCVWGAPVRQDDHAARALRAARRLRAALADAALDAAIGVSSGEVVAGNVGTEERYEYTVIGDPVNEAARLTEAAKERPERVLASGAAVQSAGEEAEHWHPIAKLRLRGRDAVTEAFAPDDGA